jgi:type I restriction enzyme S subunit
MTDLSQSSPFLGSAAFITDDNVFLHNQRLGKILNTEKDNLDTEFLYHLLNSYHVRENIRQSASGTTVKHTSPDRFYSVLVVIPPKDIQEEFSSTVLGFREQIQLNGKENKHLENLRNYLLPRLLTGAIEVTVAEEQIEEALSSV